jgi:fumigallin biosynthesis monooxygenase-like protein
LTNRIFKGRYTAKTDKPFVVFLIGMRINKWWRLDKWWPVAYAMRPMLVSLFTNPEKGFLHAEHYWNLNGITIIQYWRSFEDLDNFARNSSDPHLAPWKKYNQAIGTDGSVGIWHDTYTVNPDQFECVYGNMPRFGLTAAREHVPAIGRRETASMRLGSNKERIIVE